jgi:putative ABC transport system substrate-binding protein
VLPATRRQFVQGSLAVAGVGLLGGCGGWPSGQSPAKVARIGFLGSSSAERDASRLAALRQGLLELGYVEGTHFAVEPRYADGDFERLPSLAADLVRLPVGLLIAEGAPAVQAAKAATTTIPIVMGNAADPVGTGLVASLARPGGNVTGLSDFNLAIVTKLLELLKEVVPTASRIAVLMNPSNVMHPPELRALRAAAPTLGVTIFALEAERAEGIDAAFATIREGRPDALIVFGDPMLSSNSRRLLALAAESRLPAIYASRVQVVDGGLMSYGTNFDALYRRAATYVDKLLRGLPPADLPVEQPTTLEFVINLQTAQALGLTIPQHVLLQATELIQ